MKLVAAAADSQPVMHADFCVTPAAAMARSIYSCCYIPFKF